jgi:SIR2-like domain
MAITAEIRMAARVLGEAAHAGRLAVLVGAGISAAAGLPTWASLTDEMLERLSVSDSAAQGFREQGPVYVASLFEAAFGRVMLVEFLRRELDRSASVAETVLPSLARLGGIEWYATTNYDPLLEGALRETGSLDVVRSDLDLTYARPGARKVLKLCGDLSAPAELTITEGDFAVYVSDKPRISAQWQSLIENRELLILGSSFRDPFVRNIWDIVQRKDPVNKPSGWLVTGPSDAITNALGMQRGIRTISLSETEVRGWTAPLREFIESIEKV